MKQHTEIIQKIESLRQQLTEYNYQYYVLDAPTVPDSVYDAMFQALLQLEKDYPQYADANSPTQRVGGEPIQSFDSIHYTYPCLLYTSDAADD